MVVMESSGIAVRYSEFVRQRFSVPLFHRFHQLDQHLVHGVKANQPLARVLNVEDEIQDTCGNDGQQDVV